MVTWLRTKGNVGKDERRRPVQSVREKNLPGPANWEMTRRRRPAEWMRFPAGMY